MFDITYRTKDGDLFGTKEQTEVEAIKFVRGTTGRACITESDGVYMRRQMFFVDGALEKIFLNIDGGMVDLMMPEVR